MTRLCIPGLAELRECRRRLKNWYHPLAGGAGSTGGPDIAASPSKPRCSRRKKDALIPHPTLLFGAVLGCKYGTVSAAVCGGSNAYAGRAHTPVCLSCVSADADAKSPEYKQQTPMSPAPQPAAQDGDGLSVSRLATTATESDRGISPATCRRNRPARQRRLAQSSHLAGETGPSCIPRRWGAPTPRRGQRRRV